MLENELFRVIIQKPGRNWFGVGTYGGNIIDVARRQADGSFLPDHLEEFVIGINIENTPNYTEVEGHQSRCGSARRRRFAPAGRTTCSNYVNASSTIRGFGFSFPDSADDRDLPLEIETCYSLAADQAYVTMDTRLINTSSEEVAIWWVEYLNGSGEVEAFQPSIGFGEPLFTAACPATTAPSPVTAASATSATTWPTPVTMAPPVSPTALSTRLRAPPAFPPVASMC